MNFIYQIIYVLIVYRFIHVYTEDVPCQWNSHAGATFNLQPLTVYEPSESYHTIDGDIACTTDVTEPNFGYVWNFCQSVTKTSIPHVCSNMGKSSAVALQYVDFNSQADCKIIGHYDPNQDDLYFSLLDSSDPSKGVSMRYPGGEPCSQSRFTRTATVDVQCSNTVMKVVFAQEPSMCSYHLVMKSYYGCPTECPITKNGLCDSHGHCAYDQTASQAYCYCNLGHYGSDCSSTSSSSSTSTSYDGYSVQLGLLITLLIITLSLLGGIGFLVHRVTVLRKEQISENSSHGTEMVETVHF